MQKVIFWHRRDLRIEDNAGLYHALKNEKNVVPVFIFDETILSLLPSTDQRVLFIHQTIKSLQESYRQLGTELHVYYGKPVELIPEIVGNFDAKAVYANRDYEPLALERDKQLFELLTKRDVVFKGSKDHVIFEKSEVMKADGTPYTVFTPYMRRWKEKLTDFHLKSYPVEQYVANLFQTADRHELPTLESMGFESQKRHDFPTASFAEKIIQKYHETRDFPAVAGTSRQSLHLRFGTTSIRKLAKLASVTNEKYFNELIWRDFYQMIIFHFPHTAKDSFRREYDQIPWSRNEVHFSAWCDGKTGYPLVDAGMRELNATGHMHNRVRMVVASFLSKHLLLDWRWGAQYFAEKLLDFELASNNGGWQWAAGCGCDAAPYFRVFNPALQLDKFDKELKYVKKWVPEYGTSAYVKPIVDHKAARELAISTYKTALAKN
ncbi:MAG: deoxyribodipyrimidine photo-lyase [Crocinitomicaceae bacterium]|nr:MAG: deoxyribodipyrimidine photo-lyase [Crocinitomicaceae bacterium]